MGLLHHYWWVMTVLVVVELCFYSSNCQKLSCHLHDLEALRDLIKELDPKPDSWGLNSSRDCCEWEGITCNSSSSLRLNDPDNTARITKLELMSKRLSGKLSESLGRLHQLRVLNLSHNFIFGSMPPSIFDLINLETLDLSYNGLTGKIPEKLNLPLLINLDLSYNLVDGLIPKHVFNLVHLETLNLSYTSLYGEIPDSINLPSLKNLDLSSCDLNGSIPTHVCHNSTELRLIRLESNSFSGHIPSGFGKCALLEQLLLGGNYLTGYIPEDLFQPKRLNLIGIQHNSFSGSLSPALGNLSRLVHLDVSSNRFSGEIPDVFNKLLELKILLADDNNFTGGIPKSLANSQTLIVLNLGFNSLSGPLRLNCDVMTNLTSLDLGSNHFNGSLPENLPSCRNLRDVNVARNPLRGQVPESFKDFHSLVYISLRNCGLVNISATLHIFQHCENLTALVLPYNFDGEMLPDHPSLHFEKLKVLVVANCGLTGSMPSWLGKSTKLQVLDLSSNSLTGAIPNLMGDLFYLDLSRNSFTGEIPKSLTVLKSLQMWSDEPSLVFSFLFRWNDVARHLVSEFLPTLELSQNNLSGPIWEEFGNLVKVHVFNLSANGLSGSIPSTLSSMKSLEVLDLSNNRISGSIPESLNNLTLLFKFSVANNNLSGRIPCGFLSETFSSLSFEGNHLSGDNLPQFPPGYKRSRASDSDFFLDFSCGVALGGLALVIVASLTFSPSHLLRFRASR